ncbi:MAG TPA: polyphosphate:AMP phosphotransferase [Steroidobacteraceae bacterium]|nr:polyphosphate:AMP phosphotransferase [Steroidobacteraceae bacterium]
MARRRLHAVLSSRRLTKLEYEHALPGLQDRLLDAQFELRQQKERAVLLVVSGIPAAGRSEVVNEMLGWLDPKFVDVYGFKACSDAERERPPMWRFWHVLPPKGRIAILHGGWYQDLLQQALEHDGSSRQLEARVRRPVARIVQLERMLAHDGITVAKVHLHIAPETQRKRLRKLQADRTTRWRVTAEDRRMCRHYRDVERALERSLDATDHPSAPWSLVDGTDAQHRALEVGRRLLEALQAETPVGAVARNPGVRASRRSAAKMHASHAARAATSSDRQYDRELERLQGRLALLSRRKRFADHAVVAVFEGMDAAGKGGAIRRITAALDARQFHVVPISAPSPEELARPYLWRFWARLPSRGNYTIFDRSWYGRVLVERVRRLTPTRDWRRGYDEIVEFERQLDEYGIVVVKFWLTVSRAEQLARFAERDRNPLKRFKVDPEDWANRKHWDAYQRAARDMIDRTDTRHAPWTVVPADDKRQARLQVLRMLGDRVEAALD